MVEINACEIPPARLATTPIPCDSITEGEDRAPDCAQQPKQWAMLATVPSTALNRSSSAASRRPTSSSLFHLRPRLTDCIHSSQRDACGRAGVSVQRPRHRRAVLVAATPPPRAPTSGESPPPHGEPPSARGTRPAHHTGDPDGNHDWSARNQQFDHGTLLKPNERGHLVRYHSGMGRTNQKPRVAVLRKASWPRSSPED